MTSVKTRLPSRKVLPYSDQLIYEANVVNCNCFYSSIKPTQIDNIWYAHFWTTPHRAKNKRFLTLRCTKTGSTQPKLSAACFVVQSCLADADFVVFSNYCLIGTRQKSYLFYYSGSKTAIFIFIFLQIETKRAHLPLWYISLRLRHEHFIAIYGARQSGLMAEKLLLQ